MWVCHFCYSGTATYFVEDDNGTSVIIRFDRYVDILISFFELKLNDREGFQDEDTQFQPDGATVPIASCVGYVPKAFDSGKIVARQLDLLENVLQI